MTDNADLWSLQVEWADPWLIIQVQARSADVSVTDGFAQQIWSVAERDGRRQLILDLGAIAFMSSALMSELVRIHKRCAQHDGRLRLCNLRPECHEALHICRLDQILACYATRHDALRV